MTEKQSIELGLIARSAFVAMISVGCISLAACGQDAAPPSEETLTCLETGCPVGTRCDEIFLICVQESEPDQTDDADAGNDSFDADIAEDVSVEPDVADEPDETAEDVADESTDTGGDSDEQDVEVADETVDQQLEVNDTSDADADEPDPIEVLPPVTGAAATLQLPEGVRLSWDLPRDDEGELVAISGIRVNRDGALFQDIGFPTITEVALREMVPGQDYRLSIQTFLNSEAGRVFSSEVDVLVSVPEPVGLSLTPRAEVVLAAPTDHDAGEQTYVNVNLYYGDFTHDSGGSEIAMPWAELYRSGARKQSPTATITSTDEDVVVVDATGVITAVGEGAAQVRVQYAWLGGFISEALDVTVVDGTEQELLVITAELDTDLEEAPLIRVEVVGSSGSTHSLNDGVPLHLLVPVGTHELIVGPVAGPIYRQTVNVQPGIPARVTIPWTDRADCGTIGAAGGRLVADNGAVLNIPNGALRITQEVCIRPLGPGLAPRRGPATSYPLVLPEAYEITPNSAELVKNATLSMPIAPDLVDFVEDQFGAKSGVLPVYRHELVMWFPETIGQIETLGGKPFITAELSQFGVYSAQLCPGVGTAVDSCRVTYGSCESDTSLQLHARDGAFCGDPVTVSTTDEPVRMTDLDDNDDVDLAGVSAHAFGVHGDFEQSLSCTTNPCPAGESCDQCMATAAVASCGRTYRGSIERHDGDTGWWAVQDVSLLVPVHLGCERVLERCGGDDCLPSTLDCAASCLEGE